MSAKRAGGAPDPDVTALGAGAAVPGSTEVASLAALAGVTPAMLAQLPPEQLAALASAAVPVAPPADLAAPAAAAAPAAVPFAAPPARANKRARAEANVSGAASAGAGTAAASSASAADAAAAELEAQRSQQQRLASRRYRAKQKEKVEQLKLELRAREADREQMRERYEETMHTVAALQQENARLLEQVVPAARFPAADPGVHPGLVSPSDTPSAQQPQQQQQQQQQQQETQVKQEDSAQAAGSDSAKADDSTVRRELNVERVRVVRLVQQALDQGTSDLATATRLDFLREPASRVGVMQLLEREGEGLALEALALVRQPQGSVSSAVSHAAGHLVRAIHDALADRQYALSPSQAAALARDQGTAAAELQPVVQSIVDAEDELDKHVTTTAGRLFEEAPPPAIASAEVVPHQPDPFAGTSTVTENLRLMVHMEAIRQAFVRSQRVFRTLVEACLAVLTPAQTALVVAHLDEAREHAQRWQSLRERAESLATGGTLSAAAAGSVGT